MKLFTMSLLLTCFTISAAAETSSNAATEASDNNPPVDHSAIFQHSNHSKADIKSMRKAEVVSVLNTKGYTYIEVNRDDEPVWLAVPTTEVEAGDTVHYTDGPVVRDHNSRTLNKTFPSVIFLLEVVVNSDQ